MKNSFYTVAVTVLLLMLLGCVATVPTPQVTVAPPPAVAIDRWADNHPKAASELGNWVKKHPQSAGKFFEWDGTHPDRSKMFVTWAITNPGEGIDVFVTQHPGWPYFYQLMENHRPAAQELINWSRRHPAAAEALMSHPRGLQWAGNHLYKTYWEMKGM